MPIETINPTTGETLQSFETLTSAQLEQKLATAKECFATWRNTSFATRAALLLRTADLLDADKQQLGKLLTLEMGKTLASAIAEIEKCALACRYFAANAEAMLLSNSHRSIKPCAESFFTASKNLRDDLKSLLAIKRISTKTTAIRFTGRVKKVQTASA